VAVTSAKNDAGSQDQAIKPDAIPFGFNRNKTATPNPKHDPIQHEHGNHEPCNGAMSAVQAYKS
jgi:hypothetical protein